MAVIGALRSLVGNDDVATLEARSASAAAELASVAASQVVYERALLDSELRGDVKAGDAAVLKLEAATKQVDRLRVRRSAIADALAGAKAEKATAAKAERCAAYRAEAERARLATESAEKVCIAAIIHLADAISTYGAEGAREREAVALIAREGGGVVGCARRSVGIIEAAAMKQAQTLSSFQICLPALR